MKVRVALQVTLSLLAFSWGSAQYPPSGYRPPGRQFALPKRPVKNQGFGSGIQPQNQYLPPQKPQRPPPNQYGPPPQNTEAPPPEQYLPTLDPADLRFNFQQGNRQQQDSLGQQGFAGQDTASQGQEQQGNFGQQGFLNQNTEQDSFGLQGQQQQDYLGQNRQGQGQPQQQGYLGQNGAQSSQQQQGYSGQNVQGQPEQQGYLGQNVAQSSLGLQRRPQQNFLNQNAAPDSSGLQGQQQQGYLDQNRQGQGQPQQQGYLAQNRAQSSIGLQGFLNQNSAQGSSALQGQQQQGYLGQNRQGQPQQQGYLAQNVAQSSLGLQGFLNQNSAQAPSGLQGQQQSYSGQNGQGQAEQQQVHLGQSTQSSSFGLQEQPQQVTQNGQQFYSRQQQSYVSQNLQRFIAEGFSNQGQGFGTTNKQQGAPGNDNQVSTGRNYLAPAENNFQQQIQNSQGSNQQNRNFGQNRATQQRLYQSPAKQSAEDDQNEEQAAAVSGNQFPTRKNQNAANQNYLPPPTTPERPRYPEPTTISPDERETDESDENEAHDPNIAIATAVARGQYYLLQPDGRLQRVVYKTTQTEDDIRNNAYSAKLIYQNVEPITAPIYAYNAPLVKLY